MKQLAVIVIGLQIAAAIVLALEAGSRNGKNMVLLFSMCLLASQACLLGIWVAFSTWRPALRLLTAAFASAVVVAEFQIAAKLSPTASLAIAVAPVVCLSALQVELAGAARLVRLNADELARFRRRPQFNIMQMLALTALVAVSIVLLQALSHSRFRLLTVQVVDDYTLDMATFSLCAVPVALACSWAAFSTRRTWRHWLMLFVLPAAVGIFPALYRQGPERLIFVLAAYLQTAIVGASLAPFRLQGYRLIAPGSAARPSVASAPAPPGA